MATAEQRTIIETETAGWFDDPVTGKKTRKQDGDRVVTRAEYDQMVFDAEGNPGNEGNPNEQEDATVATTDQQDAEAKAEATQERNGEHREQAAQAAKPTVELTSGKSATGNTVTIKCAWVDPDKRTKKQQKLFEKFAAGDRKALTYDKVLAAAEGDEKAMPDGRERVIKPQDAFQVRFHSDNQPKWRAELRRAKNKVRREAAKKAAKAAS